MRLRPLHRRHLASTRLLWAQMHVSTLQNALSEAASGKTVNWLGNPDIRREYIYVPDAMRIAAAIGGRAEAFGGHWSCPAAPRSVVDNGRNRRAPSRECDQVALGRPSDA